ncbi:MAG: hypothetical protein WEB52_01675 [Dehalococcoidia bacterium]
MGRSSASRKKQSDYDRALADEREQTGAAVREHVIVVSPGNLSFDVDFWTNAKIALGAGGDKAGVESTGKPRLRVVPGDTTNHFDRGDDRGDDDGNARRRGRRAGTAAGQLPLPDAPAGSLREPGEMAADDAREADDVFAENSEIAFESRAETPEEFEDRT